MSNFKKSFLAVFIAAIVIISSLGCSNDIKALNICVGDSITMEVGATFKLTTDLPTELASKLIWTTSDISGITIDQNGTVCAKSVGQFTVTVTYLNLTDSIIINVISSEEALPAIDEAARNAFYGDCDPADSYEEAIERSLKGEISGADRVPDQAPTISEYRPTSNGLFIRNSSPYFADNNTYVVVCSCLGSSDLAASLIHKVVYQQNEYQEQQIGGNTASSLDGLAAHGGGIVHDLIKGGLAQNHDQSSRIDYLCNGDQQSGNENTDRRPYCVGFVVEDCHNDEQHPNNDGMESEINDSVVVCHTNDYLDHCVNCRRDQKLLTTQLLVGNCKQANCVADCLGNESQNNVKQKQQ